MRKNTPNFSDVEISYERIKKYIHNTPVLTSKSINKITGAEIYFKCENFQKTGAFKFRGATNAILSLHENNKGQAGVTTHSSGNHAAALSYAAASVGIEAQIVMPNTAPQIKKNAVESYGGKISLCKSTQEARKAAMEKIVEETNAIYISSADNFDVISGQATCAMEFMTEIKDLDIITAPVGGGGLLSGTALSAKKIKHSINVIGCEPEKADDAYKSFKAGYIIPSNNPITVADGLLPSLGILNFEIIKNKVDNILTASEENIIKAMQLVWERMKIIIEPSSAVPLAVILEHKAVFENKKVGIIVSGGNVDVNKLPF